MRFLIAVGAGILVVLSMIVNTAIAVAGSYFHDSLLLPAVVLQLINFIISFLLMTAVFMLVYKTLPDAYVAWGDAWVGAIATALLFDIGSLILSTFVAQAGGSPYGTAASVLALLVWGYQRRCSSSCRARRIFAINHGEDRPSIVLNRDSWRRPIGQASRLIGLAARGRHVDRPSRRRLELSCSTTDVSKTYRLAAAFVRVRCPERMPGMLWFLVAGIYGGRSERRSGSPRSTGYPRIRIDHQHFVLQRRYRRVPVSDQLHVAGRPSPAPLWLEVGRLITSVSPPCGLAPRQTSDGSLVQSRTSIERDDARRVDHLGDQYYVILGLNDLHVLVVPTGGEWRTRIESEDAAVGRTAVLRPVSGMISQIRPPFLGSLLRCWREGRHFSVRRIDDQRRAPGADGLCAAVEPEVVIEAG
jgi:hypothetical protein